MSGFICFLFSMGSGAALLLAIVAKRSLGMILALFGLLLFSTYLLVWRRVAPGVKANLKTSAARGAVAGIFATLAYDLWRFLLVKFAGFQFNPFDTLSLFGSLIAGPRTSGHVAFLVGALYHYLNGAFGAIRRICSEHNDAAAIGGSVRSRRDAHRSRCELLSARNV